MIGKLHLPVNQQPGTENFYKNKSAVRCYVLVVIYSIYIKNNYLSTMEKQKAQHIHTDEVHGSSLCMHIQNLDTHTFNYPHLHAIIGAFYVHFLVNIYQSGTAKGRITYEVLGVKKFHLHVLLVPT